MNEIQKKLKNEKELHELVTKLNQLSNENINAYDLNKPHSEAFNIGSYFYSYPCFGQPTIGRVRKANGSSNYILQAKTTEELIQRLKDFLNGFEASVLPEFNIRHKSIFNK